MVTSRPSRTLDAIGITNLSSETWPPGGHIGSVRPQSPAHEHLDDLAAVARRVCHQRPVAILDERGKLGICAPDHPLIVRRDKHEWNVLRLETRQEPPAILRRIDKTLQDAAASACKRPFRIDGAPGNE